MDCMRLMSSLMPALIVGARIDRSWWQSYVSMLASPRNIHVMQLPQETYNIRVMLASQGNMCYSIDC